MDDNIHQTWIFGFIDDDDSAVCQDHLNLNKVIDA
jgi:hypothetical protein